MHVAESVEELVEEENGAELRECALGLLVGGEQLEERAVAALEQENARGGRRERLEDGADGEVVVQPLDELHLVRSALLELARGRTRAREQRLGHHRVLRVRAHLPHHSRLALEHTGKPARALFLLYECTY